MRDLKRALLRPVRRLRHLAPGALPSDPERVAAARVSVMLATYDRRPFLARCLAALMATLPRRPGIEVIAWDNASTDGSAKLLDRWAARDGRLRVVHHAANIGLNAYARMARQAHGEFLVHLDDDVLLLPDGWLERLLDAFLRLPRAGYLAAGVVQDEWTRGGKNADHRYVRVAHAPDLVVDWGAAGQWCAITSRAIYDEVGGFPEREDAVFFWADRVYRDRLRRAGYRTGVLETVRVYHAQGPSANEAFRGHYEAKVAQLPQDGQVPFVPRGGFWAAFEARYGPLSEGLA